MQIGELFQNPVAERIEPVIKVGETKDEQKLAGEVGSYVVTPLIEAFLDDVLEHYTDSFQAETSEVGIWLSGYFGSGKSHLAKILGLVVQNRTLRGATACERFLTRVPHDSPRRRSIERSLARIGQCETDVLAFNLNSLADSEHRPLASLLLSQFYVSLGYSSNFLYARVIEAELDRRGQLDALHAAAEARAGKKWADLQDNPTFFRRPLYEAACEVAPDVFASRDDVERALRDAQQGELHNVPFLIDTVLGELRRREARRKRPQRLLVVLDEAGQWIGKDAGRLADLQSLVEEAAVRGQGRLWIVVTTHGDMGSVFHEARALDGDMKKIEGRFRFKFPLTTENIELVLEERLFRKTVAGSEELGKLYTERAGVLRELGELAQTNQALPPCTAEKFATYYPFFPYQVHLVPEIVKSLRSKGGRGEQLSGSTRTLLAITQDVLRDGRRPFLGEAVGPLVSFDEVYGNLCHEGEISPDVRTELSRLKDVVPGATPLTARVAEVLYLVHELSYIPRSRENVARMLAEDVEDDLPRILARVDPELERLMAAKLVARIGDDYEFLTGERRTFEEEVATVAARMMQQDRERGLADSFVHGDGKAHWRRWLDFDTVAHLGAEFPFRLRIDAAPIPGRQGGDVIVDVTTPLAVLGPTLVLADVETRSLHEGEQSTLFVFCGRVPRFDQDLTRYLAMREVIGNWKGSQSRSEEARRLALEREANDLPKLERRVTDGLVDGLRTSWVVFRGASRSLSVRPGQKPSDALRAELALFWPTLYPKFDRVPVRLRDDQRAVRDVLAGLGQANRDLQELKVYDRGGRIDRNAPLLDAIRLFLATRQNAGRRVLGKDLRLEFSAPPYGWDPNALRVGVAALVRDGACKVLLNKKPYTNPEDRDMVDALRNSRRFDDVEVVAQAADVAPEVLTETRTFLIRQARRRNIDETPAAVAEAAGALAETVLTQAHTVRLWADAAGLPLPAAFMDGEEAWRAVRAFPNPADRVKETHANRDRLSAGAESVERLEAFRKEDGARFVELARFTDELLAVDHALPPDGSARVLLAANHAAAESASFADRAVWKQLLALKAQAALEVRSLVEGWRETARARLESALARLPVELVERGLPPEESAPEGGEALGVALSAPLRTLIDGLESATAPAAAHALPARADRAVEAVAESIRAEVARREARPATDGGSRPRPAQRLRVRDVATVTRVATVPEWDALRDKLDRRVRALLSEGHPVELD